MRGENTYKLEARRSPPHSAAVCSGADYSLSLCLFFSLLCCYFFAFQHAAQGASVGALGLQHSDQTAVDALYLPPVFIFLFDLLFFCFFWVGAGGVHTTGTTPLFLFFEPNGRWMKFRDGILSFYGLSFDQKVLLSDGGRTTRREVLLKGNFVQFGGFGGRHIRQV